MGRKKIVHRRNIAETYHFLANSGGVTEAEFIEKMNELNPSIDQTDQIKEMFKRIDRNSDNEITFIEFFTRLPQIMECL